jgi:hypothetical protein
MKSTQGREGKVGIVELEYYQVFHPILIRSGERELSSIPSPRPSPKHEEEPEHKARCNQCLGAKKEKRKTVNAFLWRSSLWNPMAESSHN